jgi:hypothetical protein
MSVDLQTLESQLVVGTKIRIGKRYVEEYNESFNEGQIIELIEGYFEHDNGLYVDTIPCPSIATEDDDFDSIYHLFGNKLEYWFDCEIVSAVAKV